MTVYTDTLNILFLKLYPYAIINLMFKLIFLTFFPLYLISATISVNFVRDNNQTYSVVHIEDSEDIQCVVKMNAAFKDELICKFHGEALRRTQALENRYFNINFSRQEIKISPKHLFKYYPFKKTFVNDEQVDTFKGFNFKHWIIVGYKDKSKMYTDKIMMGYLSPLLSKKYIAFNR